MTKTFLKTITLLALMLILSACQNPVVEKNSESKLAEIVPISWVKLPAQSVTLNASIDLPNKKGLASEQYIIQSLYTSALGARCLQASNNQTGVLRVLCQANSEYWQPMPFYNQVTP